MSRTQLEAGTGTPGKGETHATVVVVGGGVSGCTCAAWLASRGMAVTVVSAALDSVGQPAYGPVLSAGDGGLAEVKEVMQLLPEVLREVWLDAAVAAGGGGECVVVDRRMLSVETKRALERVEGLRFRQGLVVDVRVGPGSGGTSAAADAEEASETRVAVETAFGEIIEADAVIIATGLSAGGHVRVGEDVLPGGRYGESAAEGLAAALEELGAMWADATVEVGPRFMGRDAARLSAAMGGDRERCAEMREESAVPLRAVLGVVAAEGREPWPDELPGAPHWDSGLGRSTFVLAAECSGGGVVAPDGVATGEVYVENVGGSCVRGRPTPTRAAHVVRGRSLANLNPSGRLRVRVEGSGGVWVTGRLSGAKDYLESLRSGVCVAGDVLETVVGAESHAAGVGRGMDG